MTSHRTIRGALLLAAFLSSLFAAGCAGEVLVEPEPPAPQCVRTETLDAHCETSAPEGEELDAYPYGFRCSYAPESLPDNCRMPNPSSPFRARSVCCAPVLR